MNGITKAWTYGVAYLSLAVGSGVSISGNIADTYRVAGAVGRVPDGLDIAISAFWPAAVLLAIEMFVSRLWPQTTPMQAVRWAGSLGIGFVAMYVSWHHLADLLSSRGQDGIVATVGPLAIDGLAIMATGLILSSRGHKLDERPAQATLAAEAQEYLDNLDETRTWLDTLAETTDGTTTPAHPLETGSLEPVSGPPALVRSNEVKPESVPETARMAFKAWTAADPAERPAAGQMHAIVAGDHGVSPRTARRWYYAAKATL